MSNPVLRPPAEPLGELERSAVRRTAFRILPLLMICYFVAYLGRVNLSFAALQMNHALGLNSAAYGLGAGLFFLTYCLFEIPSNLLLYRIGATRWIARIMITLGLCAGAMAFVQGKTSFYVVRMLLGAAEAGFYPGVLFFLTLWFPSAYRARMLGLFIAAIPISGIIGAPLSGLLLSLDGLAGLAGWQWLYLIEAAPAFVLAPLVVRRLQDSPAQASWLPDAEREWLIGRLRLERTAVERKRIFSVMQCLSNPRVLFLAAIYFSNVCLLNSITFFLPQIVKGFGLSSVQTGFVVAIPSLLALFALIGWARHSDRHKERYGHAALANFAGGAALLLSVLVHRPDRPHRGDRGGLCLHPRLHLAILVDSRQFPDRQRRGRRHRRHQRARCHRRLLSPWFIGYMKDTTGNFRIGLAVIAVLAMAFSAALYLLRRTEPTPVGAPA
jgi:ACS family tartrate transporter-like MFS transporter